MLLGNSCYKMNICILINHIQHLCIQNNTHILISNSTCFTIFTVMYIFTFNCMNSLVRLLSRFDNELAIDLAISINFNL